MHSSSYKPRSENNLHRISLLELQRLIDLNRINPLEPIDISTLCNTNLYRLNVDHDRQYGFHLTDEVRLCNKLFK